MRKTIALAYLLVLLASDVAAKEVRLGNDVRPVRQSIRLQLDPDKTDYSGSVSVDLEVAKPVTSIRFHAQDMTLERAVLTGASGDIVLETKPAEYGHVVATAAKEIAPGRYKLAIDFKAPFGKRAVGLYRYAKGNEGYAFTQFEAADARKAFPIWDEPSFKIPYQMTLVIPAAMEAVTNTPLVKTTPKGDWKELEFAETKPLPSYLLALAVGRLEFLPIEGMKIPGRIVTTKGQSQLGTLAAKTLPGLLEAEEKYFGMPYPYEKLDLIAIPEYWPGAMEHPGAVTYAEGILLLDESRATPSQRRTLVRITAHELAHMWFGDLVTMAWWDDLWLNESFADWFGDKITNEQYPNFKLDLNELQILQEIMQADAQLSTTPVRQPIDVADQALSTVGIAYNKGKSVLGMIEQWVGSEKFQKGVIAYLKAHEHGNAIAADLVSALSQASGKDLTRVFGTFLDQPGYPLITVKTTPAGVELSQKRFTNAGIKAPAATWAVPVVLKYSNGKEVKSKTVLLDSATMKVDLGGQPEWVLPNAQAAGYYRWDVGEKARLALPEKGAEIMRPRERVAFIGNTTALLSAGLIEGDDYMRIVNLFARDREPQVISSVVGALNQVKNAFISDEMKPQFAKYVRDTLSPALSRFGLEPKAGEEDAITIFRPQLITMLAVQGQDEKTMAFARQKTAEYLADGSKVHPSIVGAVVNVAAASGDRALFDEFRNRFENAKIPADRTRFLAALGNFQDPALRAEALQYVLSGPLRPNEVLHIPFGMFGDEAGREKVFRWSTENFEAIASRIPPGFVSALPFIGGGCDSKRLEATRKFFADPKRKVEGTDRELAQVTEQVKDCVALRARESARVKEYLATLQ